MASHAPESKETNVAVVVRIRPLSDKEIRENSPSCVNATPNRKELLLRMPSQQDSSPSKSYHFDRVFGPEVDQATVFHEVVSGMLTEVLGGFNCTIFAYGQTGTGKTHTMEGDLSTASSVNAGIVPRALQSLFETLERETAEYSVRVSFMELYNEELNDLLTPDNEPRKLRVYEDNTRKGSVVIQGLEELLVKNASDVITILQNGSNKRQTAFTKMNHASSRSHAIFSITVHTKESTPQGEELVKVGKLNLVDLAGSENIGRSGAENKRAKEAGMINQSLLTLGRVINALVERSPHIPYRESKLTRILQDSLGGRTKTCIIAAVSPAKCNIDETMSTLDYAHRAKNIRNKPEANQRMTKRALIRDYITEIERLKADLAATREKNGIFLSKDNYDSLLGESQARKDRIDEIARTLVAKEEQRVQLERQFSQKVEILHQTSSQLTATMTELEERKAELGLAMDEILQIQNRLMAQEYIIREQATTEEHLHSVAGTLVDTVRSSVHDIESLHDKLDRKRALDNENQSLYAELQDRVTTQAKNVDQRIAGFCSQSASTQASLAASLDSTLQVAKEGLSSASRQMSEDLKGIAAYAQSAKELAWSIQTQSQDAQSEIAAKVLAVQQRLEQQTVDMAALIQHIRQSYETGMIAQRDEMARASEALGQSVHSLHRQTVALIAEAVKSRDEHHAKIQSSLTAHVRALEEQNRALEQQARHDREALDHAHSSLLKKMTEGLAEFVGAVSTRDAARLDASRQLIHDQTRSVAAVASELEEQHREQSKAMAGLQQQVGHATLDTVDSTHARFEEAADACKKRVDDSTHETCASLERLVATTNDALSSQAAELLAFQSQVNADIAKTAADQAAVITSHEQMQSASHAALAAKLQTSETGLVHGLDQIRSLVKTEANAASALVSDIADALGAIRVHLETNSLVADTPTGKTPRRRAIRYPTSWKRTRNHEELIAEYQQSHQQMQGVQEHRQQSGGMWDAASAVSTLVSVGGLHGGSGMMAAVAAAAAEAEMATATAGSPMSSSTLGLDVGSHSRSTDYSDDGRDGSVVTMVDAEPPTTPGPSSKLPRSRGRPGQMQQQQQQPSTVAFNMSS